MKPRMPVIGVSSCILHPDLKRKDDYPNRKIYYLEAYMGNFLMEHGVVPWLLPPPHGAVTSDELVSQIDGLLLQGGVDISPQTYHENAAKSEWAGDPVRDEYELEILRKCLQQQKPIFGICRGLQLVNVALGGTLHQDIPHHRVPQERESFVHEIRIEKGSQLSRLYGGREVETVNSLHHQAIKKLGKDLVVEAYCPSDNIPEAIRSTGKSYLVAVQWHPEFAPLTKKRMIDIRPLMEEFLTQVGLTAQKRGSSHLDH